MNQSILIAIISTGSTLLGISVGSVLNHILERKTVRGRLFFEARKISYGKFIGLTRNIILEPATEKDTLEFNNIASEALLISNSILREELVDLCNSISLLKRTSLGAGSSFDIKDQNILIEKLKKIELSMTKELKI
ncbi:MAG: hypothetical protein WC694_01225 [Candidatus Paceibacterota bacterium]|jgi:hypothetical protein